VQKGCAGTRVSHGAQALPRFLASSPRRGSSGPRFWAQLRALIVPFAALSRASTALRAQQAADTGGRGTGVSLSLPEFSAIGGGWGSVQLAGPPALLW